MPRARLKDLIINRVDLVDKGDNPPAAVQLFKRDGDSPGGGDITDPPVVADPESFAKKVYNHLKDLFVKEGVSNNMSFELKKFVEGAQNQSLKDRINKLSNEQRTTVEKAMAELDEQSRTETVLAYEVDKVEKDAQIADLQKQLDDMKKNQPNDGSNDNNDGDDDDPTKNIPEDVWKQMPEEVKKSLQESQKQAKEASELAKKLQEEKLNGEYIAKVRDIATDVVTEPDKVGPVLKRIADNSNEDYEIIEATLKAANEMVRKNNQILKEIGSGGEGSGGSAWAKIEEKAEEYKKADPNLTQAQAIRKVLREHRDLYKQYQEEEVQ